MSAVRIFSSEPKNFVPAGDRILDLRCASTDRVRRLFFHSSHQQKVSFEEVVLCRMRIGHTRATHSFLFKRTPPPSCRCGDLLTVLHILSCHLHANIRASLPTPPVLSDSPEGVDSLINYLKAINLYHSI
ncbi:hypothetical protein M8J77_007721 [Diaphorina citri]|nr:hypothetical protein M8J77_007721 [Diaphorina citri]